jgi:hypothetical protein
VSPSARRQNPEFRFLLWLDRNKRMLARSAPRLLTKSTPVMSLQTLRPSIAQVTRD